MIATAFFWEYLIGSLLVYWLLPARWRMSFLACASLAYLAVEAPRGSRMLPEIHAAILGTLAAFCYTLGPRTGMPRDPQPESSNSSGRVWHPVVRSAVFWMLIVLILGYLLYTKYVLAREHAAQSTISAYVLPLGISYVAFKLIHALVEFARGTVKGRGIDSFFASVFLFPTLPAGPIERYDHFLLNRSIAFNPDDLLQGLTRIVLGFIKRFFLAEYFFGHAWQFVTEGRMVDALPHLQPLAMWRLSFFCVFYMYLDFSAYSDIAIGCSRLFGLRIMENFNWPLVAPNLPSFWRRWHMTLTGWCQSYVFMPVLGLTRAPQIATFATFVVIGLWHGSAGDTWPWALWGGYHGLGMIGHQRWAKLKRNRKWVWCNQWWWYGAGIAMTLAFVSVGDLLALAGPSNPGQVGTIFERLVFVGGTRHA